MLKLRKIGMKISRKEYYKECDKSKFDIFGSIRQYVRRRVGKKAFSETWWRFFLVWGCMSASGVDNIVRIDGIMNAEMYKQVLILIGNVFIF